ncbi:MAG: hypothetical protein JXA94_01800 [Parachlamydiales bacterium]|nr:hypothetical protein [Parachlamydiales bacterium]
MKVQGPSQATFFHWKKGLTSKTGLDEGEIRRINIFGCEKILGPIGRLKSGLWWTVELPFRWCLTPISRFLRRQRASSIVNSALAHQNKNFPKDDWQERPLSHLGSQQQFGETVAREAQKRGLGKNK